MNNLCKLWPFLFFVLILTLITESSTLNWFEAQEQCRGKDGLTMSKTKSNQSYWTGRYRRITPWIKIQGCFSDSFLSNISTELYINVSMWKKAVGICQETCQRKNTTVFAVKGSECLCIKSVGRTSWPVSADPSNCNFQCQNTNKIYKNECGGNSSYNVFEFISDVEDKNKGCMSLQCSSEDKRFIPQPCSTALSKVCHFQDASSSGYDDKWIKAMKDCKSANTSSYLFGDMDIDNAAIACNQPFIPKNFGLGWIGVAGQKYINKDDGLQFGEKEKQSFVNCQTCNQTKCEYIKCDEKINNSVFCANENVITVETSSPSSVMVTTFVENKTSPNKPMTSNSNYITRQTSDTTDHKIVSEDVSASETELEIGADDSSSDIVIIITAIGVLAVVTLSAVVLIFYIRRKRLRQSDATKETTTENPSNKTVCTEERNSSNNPYFVLEKDSQEISSRSQIITESPYNDTEEGEYDHLRNIRSRKDEEEDTYQHASVGIPDDVSDYDTMANTAVNKIPDEEGTYDHAHPNTNRNSDYGYNMTTHASLNDNPYDMAERK